MRESSDLSGDLASALGFCNAVNWERFEINQIVVAVVSF